MRNARKHSIHGPNKASASSKIGDNGTVQKSVSIKKRIYRKKNLQFDGKNNKNKKEAL